MPDDYDDYDDISEFRSIPPQFANIFASAYKRTQTKGVERHGDVATAIENQPIFTILHELKSDDAPLLFQAVKKIYESRRLEGDARENELLDAIIYIACAILYC